MVEGVWGEHTLSLNKILAKQFLILLESSEIHFNLVAKKIRTKVNNLAIYGEILVNFLKILSDHIQKIKKGKTVKMGVASVSKHCASSGTIKIDHFSHFLRIFRNHISKNENRINRKIVFS